MVPGLPSAGGGATSLKTVKGLMLMDLRRKKREFQDLERAAGEPVSLDVGMGWEADRARRENQIFWAVGWSTNLAKAGVMGTMGGGAPPSLWRSQKRRMLSAAT